MVEAWLFVWLEKGAFYKKYEDRTKNPFKNVSTSMVIVLLLIYLLLLIIDQSLVTIVFITLSPMCDDFVMIIHHYV